MISQTDLSGKLALDSRGLDQLRQSAKANSPDALKTAATQFEALFLNMMMKSMREATSQEGMFDNQQTKMYTSMLDQQMSQNLAKRGVGLADVLIRQLSHSSAALAIGAEQPGQGNDALPILNLQEGAKAPLPSGNAVAAPLPGMTETGRASAERPAHIRAFQDKLGAHADEASRATGVPAKFMLGQAALESGWGKREIKSADGSPSHNLFGIKAGPGWKGKVVQAVTTEYENGVAQTRVEKFRAYDSYADSFRDYAKLLTGNRRYDQVLASAQDASSFAQGLQRAGYATDPHYATKLTRIIKHSLVG